VRGRTHRDFFQGPSTHPGISFGGHSGALGLSFLPIEFGRKFPGFSTLNRCLQEDVLNDPVECLECPIPHAPTSPLLNPRAWDWLAAVL